MANDRVQQALSRIEAAVDRIEMRIAQPAPAPAASRPDDGLADRHARLRRDTAAALARLDALLATGDED